jgi:regulator of protease activity HflC (stomatin/prohibitin superfamily)
MLELIVGSVIALLGIGLGQFNAWNERKRSQAFAERERAEAQAFVERERAAAQAFAERESAAAQAFAEREGRKAFLAGVIMDTSIPRENRVPFYEEYISLGGNGPVLKLWASGK